MILVLDTNVYVGTATISKSPFQEIDLARRDGVFNVAVTELILQEIGQVLLRPSLQKVHQMSETEVAAYIDDLRSEAIVTPGKEKVNVIKDDLSDNKFLGCAIEANADAIVSNDSHLLDLVKFRNIPIITPEQCGAILDYLPPRL